MQFSVAMCTYNGAKYLGEQLESLAKQQRLPDELVVCDDGSTDGTVALLEQFIVQSPFPVRVFRNPKNLGYSRNFAQAIKHCEGHIVALADQDDVWYPEKLNWLERVFEGDSSLEGVFSDGDILNNRSQTIGRTLWQSFLFGPEDQERFRTGHAVDALLRRNVVTGMTFALRRSTFEELPEIPRSWMHDGWLAMMLAIRLSLYACPERLVGYRVHYEQQAGTPLTIAGKLQMLRKCGLGGYADRVRERNLDEYLRTAVQFEDLLASLDQTGWGNDELRSKVRAKAQYARRGVQALEQGRLQRWRILLPHLGSYTSFSPNGLRGLRATCWCSPDTQSGAQVIAWRASLRIEFLSHAVNATHSQLRHPILFACKQTKPNFPERNACESAALSSNQIFRYAAHQSKRPFHSPQESHV